MPRIDEAKGWPDSFASKHQAEKFIAEHDLAGKKKAERNLWRWLVIDNPDGTISRSLFTQMLIVSYVRQAKKEKWRPSELAMTLAGVPKESARLWKQMDSKRKAKGEAQ